MCDSVKNVFFLFLEYENSIFILNQVAKPLVSHKDV